MTKILLTGATGYVGGEALYTLIESGIQASQISCLVRNGEHAETLQSTYPDVRIVIGDLDDIDLVEREAESADIVLHLASTSHAPSAKAIARGLQNRAKQSEHPVNWIQISGATCYAADEIASGKYGYASDATFDDVKDRDRILSLILGNTKRVVENTVLSQSPSSVKTALIVGPLIYGAGRGPVNQRSVQAPEITRTTLKLGHGFKLNQGNNAWSNIHVQDLAGLVCSLVRAADAGKDGLWNDNGVYNVENGEMTFEHLGTLVANEAHAQGLIETDAKSRFVTIHPSQADSLSDHASVLWGTNARTRATKARKMLEWTPVGQSLVDTLPSLVASEAKASRGQLEAGGS